jgi:cytosine/adenosine deaminase-related metal-dependent hydrolase
LDAIAALSNSRGKVGLSPHAPYSTVWQLLEKTAQVAAENEWPVSIHVAESQTELDMFKHAQGEMFEWLRKSGRDVSDCGAGSPVLHLERYGLLRTNLLAIHANYLARGDIALLARRNVSVVHCPRSHAYFRHEPFPAERLIRAGINVCIGTDSLATVVKTRSQPIELDMFAEMRVLAQHHASLSPKRILGMATVNGARALAVPGGLGQLSAGAPADLIALPWAGKHRLMAEDLVQHRGAITASLIDGKWAVPPP